MTIATLDKNNIKVPKAVLSSIYKKMQNMQKGYEELDHMMALMEELSGKTIKTSSKNLAHDLGN